MPRLHDFAPSFNAGELSPRLAARTDFTKYRAGLETCENLIPLAEGGLMRRPGTRFVSEVEDSSVKGRLLRFEFSTVDSHILELGHNIMRFYRHQGQIQSGGSAVEIATPWTESDLPDVTTVQTADVLYLFHPDYSPRKLERSSLTSWSLSEVSWKDGPWLDENTTSTTLTPSATSGGSVTVTASSTTGINDGDGFQSSDVGRLVRISNPSSGTSWGWGEITAVGSTTSVTVSVQKAFADTTATTAWRLGAWSGTTGWPRVATFFEQRLYVAGTDTQPQTFWASQTADFENFKPDDDAGTVEDDDALDFTLSADQVNAIRWLSAGEDTLAIGTSGGEWVPSSSGAVLTPLDITVRRQTTHGSSSVQPVRVGNVVLFLQRAGRKVREFGFAFAIDGWQAPDMTRLAQHITFGGITEMAFAEEPDSVLWAVRGDGQLLSMTYRRDEDVVGWARHIIGGSFGSGNAVVESVAVIPGTDGTGQIQDSSDRNEVWVIVKRTIDGNTKRYIEVMERPYENEHDQEDAYFADSLITYDGSAAATLTGLSHLEGETVKVWGDGAVLPEETVSSSQITLDSEVEVAQIGLGYTHKAKTLKVDAGNPAGTAVGKPKRIYGLTFVLLNSHLLEYGPDASNLLEADFRTVGDAMDSAVDLFTGEQFKQFPGDYERDVRIVIQSDDPAPFTLLAMAPEIQVNPLT